MYLSMYLSFSPKVGVLRPRVFFQRLTCGDKSSRIGAATTSNMLGMTAVCQRVSLVSGKRG